MTSPASSAAPPAEAMAQLTNRTHNRVVQIEANAAGDWILGVAAFGTEVAAGLKLVPFASLVNMLIQKIQEVRQKYKDCKDLLRSLEKHLVEQEKLVQEMMKRCNSLNTRDDALKAFLEKTFQASISLLYTISVKLQQWIQRGHCSKSFTSQRLQTRVRKSTR